MKKNPLHYILNRRKRFMLKYQQYPDILVLTEKAFNKIIDHLGVNVFNGNRLLGMDVELGDRVAVKLKSKLILN